MFSHGISWNHDMQYKHSLVERMERYPELNYRNFLKHEAPVREMGGYLRELRNLQVSK